MGVCGSTIDNPELDDEVGYTDHKQRILKMPPEYDGTTELPPAIINSARHQNWSQVIDLLDDPKTNPNIAEKKGGWSVLHFVAYHGNLETAERLLRKGTSA